MSMNGLGLAVAVHLASREGKGWTYQVLARELSSSPSTVNEAVHDLLEAGLLIPSAKDPKPIVARSSLLEFLAHGARYAFHCQPGRQVRGVPTAHSAPPLDALVLDSADPLVWAHREGTVRGREVPPLYRGAPVASLASATLHQMLALVDALRVGRVRERRLAVDLLEQRIGTTSA